MANVPMKDIQLPGLDNTYTFAQIDNTLTQTGQAADAKKTGDEITGLKEDFTQLDDKIAATQITNTASGAIASFPDGADNVPVKDLVVDIEPVQDLHGQANPYPAGGGKNLFGGEYNVKWVLPTPLSMHNGDTLTVSTSVPASGNPRINIYTGEDGATRWYNAGINDTVNNRKVKVMIFTEDVTITAFMVDVAECTNIQIESGSTATDYAPYENICLISGWTGANVNRTGFNQWDEQWEVGALTDGGQNKGDNNRIRSKNHTPVLSGTSYYFYNVPNKAVVIFYYDAEQTFITNETLSANGTFTTPLGCHFLRFYMSTTYGTTYNHDTCINFSDIAKNGTYEPYQGNTYAIDWTDEAGTVYGGTLDVTTGVLTVDRKLVDLGDRNWSLLGNTGSRQAWVAYFSEIKPPANGSTPYDAISSEFKGVSYNASWLPGVFAPTASSSATGVAFCVESGKYADASEFKEAVTGVQFCYAIAEPQTYQLTPHEVSTLLGLNNIWADCGDTTVDYRADTKLYIENLTAPSEDDMVANTNIPDATYFMVGNTLLLSTTTIPAGDTINPGTNCTKMDLAAALNAINS